MFSLLSLLKGQETNGVNNAQIPGAWKFFEHFINTSIFPPRTADEKVEDIFEKKKKNPRSYVDFFSYAWKLRGVCTVTDCQTIFGDMNSVKNWSVFPELALQWS